MEFGILLNSITCESKIEGSVRAVLYANVKINGFATSWLTALHTGMMQQAQTKNASCGA
jgi:hypothetical protein